MSDQQRLNRTIVTGFLICSGITFVSLSWYLIRRPLRRWISQIKPVDIDGQKVLKKEDVLMVISEVKGACREQLKKIIRSCKTERRRHKSDQRQYERAIKRMEKEAAQLIAATTGTVLSQYALTPALWSRSINFHNDPEINKASADLLKVSERKAISPELQREIMDTFERIQREILDSTDVNNFSDVLYHQVVDLIHEKFGVELDEIELGELWGTQEPDLRARFEENFRAESLLKNETLNE